MLKQEYKEFDYRGIFKRVLLQFGGQTQHIE